MAGKAAAGPLGLVAAGTVVEVFRSKGLGPKVAAELDPEAGLVRYLHRARRSLVFAIFSVSSKPIGAEIARLHALGRTVRGVADATHAVEPYSLVRPLQAQGVDVAVAVKQHAFMHLKVAVIDSLYVALGSFNWTGQAERRNDEVLVVLRSREVARVCIDQIDQIRELNKADIAAARDAVATRNVGALGDSGPIVELSGDPSPAGLTELDDTAWHAGAGDRP